MNSVVKSSAFFRFVLRTSDLGFGRDCLTWLMWLEQCDYVMRVGSIVRLGGATAPNSNEPAFSSGTIMGVKCDSSSEDAETQSLYCLRSEEEAFW